MKEPAAQHLCLLARRDFLSIRERPCGGDWWRGLFGEKGGLATGTHDWVRGERMLVPSPEPRGRVKLRPEAKRRNQTSGWVQLPPRGGENKRRADQRLWRQGQGRAALGVILPCRVDGDKQCVGVSGDLMETKGGGRGCHDNSIHGWLHTAEVYLPTVCKRLQGGSLCRLWRGLCPSSLPPPGLQPSLVILGEPWGRIFALPAASPRGRIPSVSCLLFL